MPKPQARYHPDTREYFFDGKWYDQDDQNDMKRLQKALEDYEEAKLRFYEDGEEERRLL